MRNQNKNILDKEQKQVEELEEKIGQTLKKPVKKAARFFRIDEARRKKVNQEIKEKSEPDMDFFLLTVFSTIIVVLGLIIDNSAVVIGGMIISPLLWPILALAMSILKGQTVQLKRNLLILLKASLVIFVVSFVIGAFSPYLGESHEILIRTKPTLFELFIALAAGFIGTFAVAYPKMSAALAGVVAAVALVPPLAVMGILFAGGSFSLAVGAALLYLTNLIAITLGAVILFILVGYRLSNWEKTKSRAVSSISWFVIFLIIVSIPLTLVMKGVIRENQEKKVIRQVIQNYTIGTKVTNLSISHQGGRVMINTTLQSATSLTSRHVDRLSDILVAKLGQSVSLKINVIPTYEANNVKDGGNSN